MRTSPVHYIAPSAISITPNANNSANDLAIYIARGTKIKVFSRSIKELGLVDSSFQEWTLTGRNRRLADSTKKYTIYARLNKKNHDDAYLVFTAMGQFEEGENEGEWYERRSHVTMDNGLSICYDDSGDEQVVDDPNYWWIYMGEVGLPDEDEKRTVDFDTGILGTEQYNANWAQNPDSLPMRIQFSCKVNGQELGDNPYVHWDEALLLAASLIEGWGTDVNSRVKRWTISRNTGRPASDEEWNNPAPEEEEAPLQSSPGEGEEGGDAPVSGASAAEGEGGDEPAETDTARQMPNGQITLSHRRDSDDFAGAVAAVFTVTAWGHKEEPTPSEEEEEQEEPEEEENTVSPNNEPVEEAPVSGTSASEGEPAEGEEEEGEETPLEALATATITIMAETLETYMLVLSTSVMAYDPTTGIYNPQDGIGVRIRATDQRGETAYLTLQQLTNTGYVVQYAAVGSTEWTTLTFSGDPSAIASATVPTTAFTAQKNVNIRLASIIAADNDDDNPAPVSGASASEPAAGSEESASEEESGDESGQPTVIELATATVAFVRNGEDSSVREWIYLRSTEAITFGNASSEHPLPSLIEYGEVSPAEAARHITNESNQNEWVPEGWWDNKHGVDETNCYEYESYRDWVPATPAAESASGSSGSGESTPVSGASASEGEVAAHWGPFTVPIIIGHFGKDGQSQPSYTQTQEAWGASPTTHPAENDPGWSDVTPAKTAKYLWRRSRKMVLNATHTAYVPAEGQDGQWKYQLLSGTDGTSISIKGTVVAIVPANGTLPTTGVTTGDMALKQADPKPWIYNGSTWTQTGMTNAADGDCYKVMKDCTFDGQNVNGHLFMWSTEADGSSDDNGLWVDLGQFSGEDGDTVHIAWADDVTFNGQTPATVSGFTIGVGANNDGKAWMGICIDKSAEDPRDFRVYTWRYLKGERGADGSEREWIYKRQASETPPSLPAPVAGQTHGTVNGVDTIYQNTIDDWVPQGWTDNPQGVTPDNRYEFACWRDKASGASTWGPFTGVVVNGQPQPLLWSHYGERGTDGDGMQYIFKLFARELSAAECASSSYIPDKPAQQNPDGEWIPSGTGKNADWSDEPLSPTASLPYCYCSTIKQINGTWGNFGTLGLWATYAESGLIIDLDNEMDAFGTDINGEVLNDQTVTTHIQLFFGLTAQTITQVLTTIRRADNNSVISNTGIVQAVVSGVNTTTATVNVTVKQQSSVMLNTDLYVEIDATCSTGTRSARFTLKHVASGAPGVSPTIYQLLPSMSSIPFAKNGDGYSPASYQNVKCGYKETTGTSTTSHPNDVSTGTYNIYYRTSSTGNYTKLTTNGVNVYYTYPFIEFILCTNTTTTVSEANVTGLIDRETVPVVKDGLNGDKGDKGDDGFTVVINPEYVIFEESFNAATGEAVLSLNGVAPKIQVRLGNSPQYIIYGNQNNNNCQATISGNSTTELTVNFTGITNSATQGYVQFVVSTVAQSGSTAGDGRFSYMVRIPFYVNRLGTFAREIIGGIETAFGTAVDLRPSGLGNIIRTSYQTEIVTSAQGLRQEFSEGISSTGSRNYFGFTGVKMTNSSYPCLPFIQGYGVILNQNISGYRGGRIQNLGMNGVGGSYVMTMQARMSAGSGTIGANLCGVDAIRGEGNVPSSSDYISISSSWTTLEFHFYIPSDNTAMLPSNGNGYLEMKSQVSGSSYRIYIRRIKLERGTTPTDFCPSDEDIANLAGGQMIPSIDYYNISRGDVEGRKGVYYTPSAINPGNWSSSTSYVDYIYKQNTFTLVAGKIYTLSFWAKASSAGFVITSMLYASSIIITNIGDQLYIPSNNGTIIEGVTSDGTTHVQLSTEWKQYFIRFYVVYNRTSVSLTALRVTKAMNQISSSYRSAKVYMSDIELQEGFAMEPSTFTSLVEQTSRRITLLQYAGSKKAGLDIQNGKFTAIADTFEIQNGSGETTFTVDENGNLVGSGDASFKGTVKATNFFHGVVIVGEEDTYYCYDDDYGTQDGHVYPYKVGKYYKHNELDDYWGTIGLQKCTGDADIIVIKTGYNDTTSVTVVLPRASDYDGKLIEIIDTRYTQPSTQVFVGTLYAVQAGGGSYMKGDFTAIGGSSLTLHGNTSNDGGSYRLLSYGGYWVRLRTS